MWKLVKSKCRFSSKIPGVNHLDAVRALEVVVPRNNPIKAIIRGGIVQDAGLTVEEFRKLL